MRLIQYKIFSKIWYENIEMRRKWYSKIINISENIVNIKSYTLLNNNNMELTENIKNNIGDFSMLLEEL